MNTIHIKNMVCPRCIVAVQNIFNELEIEPISIELGEVVLDKNMSNHEKSLLSAKLLADGFEILTQSSAKLIGQIKSILIKEIHHEAGKGKLNISELLSGKLNKEYSSLSKLFSSVEGKTIERFVVSLKIEKVKELLFYNELTLSEIAHQLHYSSTAHLSSQFKKETGLTPTAFKKMKGNKRKTLDSI